MEKIIFLFFITITILFSQEKIIRGKIIDLVNNEPLQFANVIITEKQIGTSTNENGEFVITAELDLNDIVKISYVGYEEKQILISEFVDNKQKIIPLERKVLLSQTVLIKSSLGKQGETPISFSKISKNEIEDTYLIQDIPDYLNMLPSTMFFSEGGSGIGYNYLTIRGFEQRRISVAINGIVQNDPEDHNVYYVDFPDLLESTELIQVQRGAGTGVIGYPAIGGSINIITSSFSSLPKFEFNSILGSDNTRKYGISVSSGLVDKKYSFYLKLSQIISTGYRQANWVDFKSYHLSAVRYDENFTTQINIYGGPIKDGLTYYGLPKFAIKNKELRRANYSYWSADENGYTWTQDRRVGEKEEFFQPHFEILNEFKIGDKVILNSALFLVNGEGFFDYEGSWADTSYLRLTKENGITSTDNPNNVIIRAMVENEQWGWIPRMSLTTNFGELIFGAELRFHNSVHWGGIAYGENLPIGLNEDYKYYYYEGGKDIINFFAHGNFSLSNKINLLTELQFAYHKYKLSDEKYIGTDFEIKDLFINQRIGVNYKVTNDLTAFISFARVTREPRLKNYYDAAESSGGEVPQFESNMIGKFDFTKPLVKPETMYDIELGTNYNFSPLVLSANLFYMLFNDEIVKKGQLDRFGQPTTGNVDKTIHTGIELTANYLLSENFEIMLSGTYSKNFISKGFYYIDDIDKINLSNNTISGSPDLIISGNIKFKEKGFMVNLFTKYVGKFYSDNY
ncbi:MAG: TonB-dependent receptor, partial [Ignavibacteriales bacterium]|nr:TonB-dependent receptor [Ignavibacteriales bacterium]